MAIGGKTVFNPVRRLLIKLANLTNFTPAKKPIKHGTWSTLPTWPTLFSVSLRRFILIVRINHPVELCQLGQLQFCEKACKTWKLVNFANLANIFSVSLRRLILTVRINHPVELCQLGQLQFCEKACKTWKLVNFANLANIFSVRLRRLVPTVRVSVEPERWFGCDRSSTCANCAKHFNHVWQCQTGNGAGLLTRFEAVLRRGRSQAGAWERENSLQNTELGQLCQLGQHCFGGTSKSRCHSTAG